MLIYTYILLKPELHSNSGLGDNELFFISLICIEKYAVIRFSCICRRRNKQGSAEVMHGGSTTAEVYLETQKEDYVREEEKDVPVVHEEMNHRDHLVENRIIKVENAYKAVLVQKLWPRGLYETVHRVYVGRDD